jgi:Domain of unknown function (DUF4259)
MGSETDVMPRYGSWVGTWGPGAFDNDDALDLLDALLITAGDDGAWHRDWTNPRTAAQARQTTDQLTSVFYRDQHRPDHELPPEP